MFFPACRLHVIYFSRRFAQGAGEGGEVGVAGEMCLVVGAQRAVRGAGGAGGSDGGGELLRHGGGGD
jgi:hypothetical protein